MSRTLCAAIEALPQLVGAPSQIKIIRIGQSWEAGTEIICVWPPQWMDACETSKVDVLEDVRLSYSKVCLSLHRSKSLGLQRNSPGLSRRQRL